MGINTINQLSSLENSAQWSISLILL
jgi:hypothetical protein